MKISNPTLYGTNGGVGSILTTVSYVSSYVSGQLSTVSGNLNTKIENVSGTLSGYAELSNGKIKPQNLPSITLSETKVCDQSEIIPDNYASQVNTPGAATEKITEYISKNLSGFEIGDILIVLPPSGIPSAINDYIVGTWIQAAENDTGKIAPVKLQMPSTGKTQKIIVNDQQFNPTVIGGVIDLTPAFDTVSGQIIEYTNNVSGELNSAITGVAADLESVSGELNSAITGVAADLESVSGELKTTITDVAADLESVSGDVSSVISVDNYITSEVITFNTYISGMTIEQVNDVQYTGGIKTIYATTFNAQKLSADLNAFYKNILDTTNDVCKFIVRISAYDGYLPVVTCVYEATNESSQTTQSWSAFDLIYPEVIMEDQEITINIITTLQAIKTKRWKLYFTMPLKTLIK